MRSADARAPVRHRFAAGHAAAVAALVAALLFLPALRNDFAYDDVAVVLRDARVHDLDSIPAILGAGYWQDDATSLWRPLTTLSFALDWAIRPADAAWFHAVNIAWHALATALVTLLLASLCGPLAALAGGLVFAVHPVHVEAVANVVGRAELMAACAAFGAALVWLPERHGRGRAAAAAALYLLALGAKESAIMLPALLVLVDMATGALRTDRWRPWLADRAPGLLMLVLVAATYLAIRTQVLDTLVPARVDPALDLARGAPERVFTALQVWPHIVRLLLFPRTLLADYGPRILLPRPGPDAAVVAGVMVLLGLFGGALLSLRHGKRRTALLLLWAPVALLPVSNFFFPIGLLLGERMLYLPSFAVALAVSLAVTASFPRGAIPSRAVLVAAALACVLLAGRARARIPEWRSTDAVFVALLRDRPDSFYAHWHIARVAAARGDHSAALAGYGRALSLWPYRQRLIVEAASHAALAGDTAFAGRITAHGVRVWPQALDIRRMAAGLALDRGDTIAAAREIGVGLGIDSADPTLLRMRAALEGSSP